ncbi:IS1595 family transposase [Rhizobium sp. RU20A]|uniref:IS1595 family transposase n=1 Tax=Rhizobium sp. RU20A TaxID=1907412 RepID=UPI00165FD823|nr:IS1595 family transposase [Rhizobium sp. RU20A]
MVLREQREGKSALQLSRELGCQYKTAWVLLMKMREAISTRRFRMMLEGEIHIDGKYAGGHIKPENRKEDRVDRRRAENRNNKRLTILTLREKKPFGRGQTLTRVIRSEDSSEAWEMVKKHVRKGSRLHADEHFSYDDLEGLQELHRVNHSEEYQTKCGVNTITSKASSAASSGPTWASTIASRCGTSTGMRQRSPGARTIAGSTTACSSGACCTRRYRDRHRGTYVGTGRATIHQISFGKTGKIPLVISSAGNSCPVY